MDWRQFFLDQLRNLQYTPRQVAEDITLPQLFALWGSSGNHVVTAVVDDTVGKSEQRPGVIRNPSRSQQLDMINRLRAHHGLPPVEPEGWTRDPAEGGE